MQEQNLGQIIQNLVRTTLDNPSTDQHEGNSEQLVAEKTAAIDRLTDQMIEIIGEGDISSGRIEIKDLLAALHLIKDGLLSEHYISRSDTAKLTALEKLNDTIMQLLLIKEVESGNHIDLLMENPTARAEFFSLVCTYVLAGNYDTKVISSLRIALYKLPRIGYPPRISEEFLDVRVKGMIRKIADGIEERRLGQEMAEEFRNFARYDDAIEKKID